MGVRSRNYACSPRLRRVTLGLFLSTSGAFVEQRVRAYGRLGLRLPAHRFVLLSSGAVANGGPTPFSWVALTVAHPNRATKIIPLFSGNWTR